MTHDDDQHAPFPRPEALHERYADLLGPTADADPALTHLVADLDALHAAEVPANLARGINVAADRAPATAANHAPSRSLRRVQTSGGATLMPARRLSTIVGSLAAVLVVGLLAAVLIGMSHGAGVTHPGTSETPAQRFARLGGVRVVLRLQNCPSVGSDYAVDCDVDAEIARMMQAEQQRAADGLGVQGAIVRRITDFQSDNQIEIDLPGYTDVAKAASVLSTYFSFDVIDTGGDVLSKGTNVSDKLCPAGAHCVLGSYVILFTGDQIDRSSVSAGIDPQANAPIVTFAFAGAVREQFATYTSQHIGQALTIVLDGTVIESATIQSEISGSLQLTGFSSVADAQNLASLLKLGLLPLQATVLSAELIPAGSICVPPTPGPTMTTIETPPPGATPTPAPGWTPIAGPVATPTPSPTPAGSGQAANLPPVYSGGPGATVPPAPCVTPIPTATSGGTPTPQPHQAPTPTPPPTPTPKP